MLAGGILVDLRKGADSVETASWLKLDYALASFLLSFSLSAAEALLRLLLRLHQTVVVIARTASRQAAAPACSV